MRKKGFTLIELLAVIVVLAIIALIAVPTILGVIEKARKGAAESSALNYIDAVEKYMVLHELDSNKYPYNLEKGKTYYIVEDSSFAYNSKSLIGKVYAEGEQENIYLSDFIKVKGDAPTDGYVVIGEKNTVSFAAFGMKKYEITCDNKICEVSGSFDSSNIRVSSIEINQVENTTINPGETLQLSVTILPDNATDKNVAWSSSDESIATVDNNGLVTGVSEGTVTITAKAGNGKVAQVYLEVVEKNDSILGYVKGNTFENDSIVNIEANGKTYSAHVYNFDGDQVWDTDMKFGSDNDVATETEYAKNMVVVKVNGNLAINEDVIVEPYYTEYGGPKGFLLYVTGTLTNNGTIDNSHGAKAIGEDVYLWQNENGEYEYVPAIGGGGGDSFTTTSSSRLEGKNGYDGLTVSLRATGGGGNGASSNPDRNSTIKIGSGGIGTSYSGGSGVGGCYHGYNSHTISNGSSIGGSGVIGESSFAPGSSGGGAGNPGGLGQIGDINGTNSGTNSSNYKGSNGTGGLLIIFAKKFENNGSITANGSKGGPGIASGGGSGGGSINIFYEELINKNSILALGGSYGDISSTGYGTASNGNVGYGKNGGAGGSGTVTTGSIATRTFVKD